jgi:hypothetical protein
MKVAAKKVAKTVAKPKVSAKKAKTVVKVAKPRVSAKVVKPKVSAKKAKTVAKVVKPKVSAKKVAIKKPRKYNIRGGTIEEEEIQKELQKNEEEFYKELQKKRDDLRPLPSSRRLLASASSSVPAGAHKYKKIGVANLQIPPVVQEQIDKLNLREKAISDAIIDNMSNSEYWRKRGDVILAEIKANDAIKEEAAKEAAAIKDAEKKKIEDAAKAAKKIDEARAILDARSKADDLRAENARQADRISAAEHNKVLSGQSSTNRQSIAHGQIRALTASRRSAWTL